VSIMKKRRDKKRKNIHNEFVNQIFENPKLIGINGEIVKKIRFPKSLFRPEKEISDLIVVERKRKNEIDIHLIEVKTGLFLKGAQLQCATALKYFLVEFQQWKRVLGINNGGIRICSEIIWCKKFEVPAKIEKISESVIFL